MSYESLKDRELDPIVINGNDEKYSYVNRPLLGTEKMKFRGMFSKFMRSAFQGADRSGVVNIEVGLAAAFAEAMADEKFIQFIKKTIEDVNIQPGIEKEGEFSFDEWFGIRDGHVFPLVMGINDQNFKKAKQIEAIKKKSNESQTPQNEENENSEASTAYDLP